MSNIFSYIKQNYTKSNSFTRLLYVNLAFFLIYNFGVLLSTSPELGKIFVEDLNSWINNFLALPSNINSLIKKPWTLITYMFVHTGFLHILFNLIWLHFGSKLFLQYFTGRQLVSTYIFGGIFGGLIYILAFNIFPVFQSAPYLCSHAYGASASVVAIVVAIATYSPNYSVRFPFIGIVKLKHIAIFCVVLDVLSIPQGNAGGHIAHLGGALFGYLYIKQLQKGNDISNGFSNFLNKLVNTFKTKSKLKTVHKRSKSDKQFNTEKTEQQKAVNLVLEKISKSGYESLSKKEKNILFQESKK